MTAFMYEVQLFFCSNIYTGNSDF